MPNAKPKIPPAPWTPERRARLINLITLGYSTQQIAEDPIVHTTVNNVRRQSHRLGFKMRTSRLIVTPRAVDMLIKAAEVRDTDVQCLLMRLFDVLDDNLTLLDNILDDDVVTPRD